MFSVLETIQRLNPGPGTIANWIDMAAALNDAQRKKRKHNDDLRT